MTTQEMTATKPMPWDQPEYWESMARTERAFAEDERTARYGSVESIKVHLANAEDYEYRARTLRAALKVQP